MTAKIIIVGTAHDLQCGVGEYSDSQRANYKNLILDLCASHGVKLIAEEMSIDGLKEKNVKSTVALRIARKLDGMRHANIEITNKEKCRLKIDDFSLYNFARTRFPKAKSNAENNERINKRNDRLRKSINDPIRERYWFLRMLEKGFWPTLFICGDNHVMKMKSLIQQADRCAFVCAYRLAGYLG